MQPLIKPDDNWLLWAVLIAGTGLAIWLEQTYRWAARISGPVIALVTAMLLSNVGVMPMESPAYDFVGTYLVPLAIPLLLFRANAIQIARTTGAMFVAFHISTIGTILGAFLATWLLRGHIDQIDYAAGIMAASYIGGGINFFAVKESYHVAAKITDPLLVADNFVMAGLFIVLLWIAGSRFFRRQFPHPHSLEADAGAAKNLAAEHWQRKGIALIDIAKSLAIAFAAVGLAELLKRLISSQFVSGRPLGLGLQMVQVLFTNKFVLITAVSLLFATVFHKQMAAINGPEELGGYMLYLFLFAIGLPADLKAVIFNVPLLFVFCVIIAAMNLAFTLAVGRIFRFNLEELLLCVNATVGGPPTAAAMAISTGWSKLVLPGLLAGIWGYVIGTALGVLVTETLLRWH